MAQNNIQKAISQSRKNAAAKSRGRTYKPARVSSTGSARENAKANQLAKAYAEIDVQLRKEANKHRFSTKSELEKKARAEYAAGKIPKGQLGKTIERRWKAAQKRRQKFEGQQKARRVQLRKEAGRKVSKMSNQRLGVKEISAVVLFQISSEVRTVTLSFPASPETLQADAHAALVEYMHGEGELLSVEPV